MPFYKTRVAISNLSDGDELQNSFDTIAVTQDRSGTCFLFIRDTTLNLDQEPIYIYVDPSKSVLYNHLLKKFDAQEIEQPKSSRFVLLSGREGILEEHGFDTPDRLGE